MARRRPGAEARRPQGVHRPLPAAGLHLPRAGAPRRHQVEAPHRHPAGALHRLRAADHLRADSRLLRPPPPQRGWMRLACAVRLANVVFQFRRTSAGRVCRRWLEARFTLWRVVVAGETGCRRRVERPGPRERVDPPGETASLAGEDARVAEGVGEQRDRARHGGRVPRTAAQPTQSERGLAPPVRSRCRRAACPVRSRGCRAWGGVSYVPRGFEPLALAAAG